MRMQTFAFRQMAELTGCSVEEIENWVSEGVVPIVPGTDQPNPVGKVIPRIDVVQALRIHALKEGKTPEEANAYLLAETRDLPKGWEHTPPPKTEQERTRDRIDADRQKMWQQLRDGAA